MNSVELIINEIKCKSCSDGIINHLIDIPGVIDISINIVTKMCDIKYDSTKIGIRDILKIISELGYNGTVCEDNQSITQINLNNIQNDLKFLKQSLLFSIPILVMTMWYMHGNLISDWLIFFIITPMHFFIGSKFHRNAYLNLLNFDLTMDVLISLSTLTSYIYSVIIIIFNSIDPSIYRHNLFDTSAMIFTFILLGKYIETNIKHKMFNHTNKLINLTPQTANLICDDNIMKIEINKLQLNDLLVVYPDEIIPTDGIIVFGNSWIDESMITGENMPILKGEFDHVIGGTINKGEVFRMKVSQIGGNTKLSKIIKLIKESYKYKSNIEKLGDNITRIFIPVIIGISLITLMTWTYYRSIYDGLWFFISVIVISCPCAIGLATPTAIMVGINIGAKYGILIKNSHVFEMLTKIDTLFIDKTGTLTFGKLKVNQVNILNLSISEIKLFIYLMMIEKNIRHPVAEALTNYGHKITLLESIPSADNIQQFPQGVTGIINNQTIKIGSLIFFDKHITDQVSTISDKLVIVTINDILVSIINLTDELRPESQNLINWCNLNNITVYMLTGDSEIVTKPIANHLGINYLCELTPDQKLNIIKEYKLLGHNVCMIGDGINDSPALAEADVGMTIKTGHEIALDTADVILLKNIIDFCTVMKLSKYTFRIIKINYMWAFLYNLLCIPIAAGVLVYFGIPSISPMIASLAMSLSSICVVLCSLSLNLFNFTNCVSSHI